MINVIHVLQIYRICLTEIKYRVSGAEEVLKTTRKNPHVFVVTNFFPYLFQFHITFMCILLFAISPFDRDNIKNVIFPRFTCSASKRDVAHDQSSLGKYKKSR